MVRTYDWLTMDDQVEVYVRNWKIADKQPLAIVQLSHGMAEHIERYDSFANFLLQEGIFVYGNDHRGHGHTGERAGLHGFFAEENGFDRVVTDLYEVNQFIQAKYPNVPIFLLGHSMGSFIARRYIQEYAHSIQGVIISGTGGNPGIAGKIGKQIAKREIRKYGLKKPSTVLNRLSFGAYNRGIDDPQTEFDWLSNDPKEVEKYLNDPYCGFICSSGFFYDLFTGLEKIHHQPFIQKIPKELPILIFSGDHDPVGGHTKGVRKVIQQYTQNGLRNLEYQFFKDGRHEMLNEINKDEVYQIILNWINNHIK